MGTQRPSRLRRLNKDRPVIKIHVYFDFSTVVILFESECWSNVDNGVWASLSDHMLRKFRWYSNELFDTMF